MNNTGCPFDSVSSDTVSGLIRTAVNAMSNGTLQKKKLIWLELNGCSGNIISLLDGQNPGFAYLVNYMTDFMYDNSLLAKEGNDAIEALFSVPENDYILAVEGAVSVEENGIYNIIGQTDNGWITGLDAVRVLGERASHVIAVGNCASYGGLSAASPNPSASVGLSSVLKRKVINLTGCPCNPRWFLGTLFHLLLYGEPALDDRGRPLMFYGITIHDRCPRRSYFDFGIFATMLGEETCMFNLGCKGPITYTDCPILQWNGHVNWPVGADSVCIGCAQFGFPDYMEPFVTYNTQNPQT